MKSASVVLTAVLLSSTSVWASSSKAPGASAISGVKGSDGKPPLAAVLDVRHGEGLEDMANALATVITAEVGARGDLRAVSRNELRAVLAHQEDAAILGCDSVNCMADIAKLVDAQLVIAGNVERVEDTHVFGLSLIEPAGPSILHRVEAVWRSDPGAMMSLVRPQIDRLLAGPNGQEGLVGSLEVLTKEGAVIAIDGKDVGSAPLESALTDLPIGVHTLAISLPGHHPYKEDIVVSRAETSIARVELIEIPLMEQPWFWWTAGGGAAATVVAASGTAALVGWLLMPKGSGAKL